MRSKRVIIPEATAEDYQQNRQLKDAMFWRIFPLIKEAEASGKNDLPPPPI